MRKIFFVLLSAVLLLTSCHRNRFDINVSKVKLNLRIVRFDREFCNISPDSVYSYLPRWQKYGYFWQVYSQQLLGLGNPNEITFVQRLDAFFDYCRKYHIYRDVQRAFPPGDKFLSRSLTDAFKHYKYYFPDRTIPTVYTSITGFNVSVYTAEDFVGLSLEKYLGKDYPLYANLGFELYKRRRMIKPMIPVDVMRAWAVSEFPFNDSVDNLMANMIYEGRLQYFLDAMLPDYPDTLKWGYTEQQWKWVKTYEKKIWQYLVEHNLLFSQRTLDIKTFVGDGPFTVPFHRNSAPRAGTYIGYRIVQSYMRRHPSVTLQELMQITDYMQIYNESYYEP